MARTTRKKQQQQNKTTAAILMVIIVVVFWLLLSVAFDLPILDLVKDPSDKTQNVGVPTATPTPYGGGTAQSTPTPEPSDSGTTPEPGTTASPTDAPTAAPTDQTRTHRYYLYAYRDGSSVYSEYRDYSYTGTLESQALVRTALNELMALLNYNIKYNSIILDENGLHVDLAASGAPFVKNSYYLSTGVFAAEYSTYDQQVYGILDSICYTAKDILGSNTGIFITMDGKAMTFTGLSMDTTFNTDVPYLGYTYYHEHYKSDTDIYTVAMNNGVPLTFATDVKYYFRGTIGASAVDVTLTSTPLAGTVIIKIMSLEDTPMYILNIDSNKVLVSVPEDTTIKVVLYQDAESNLIGEWHTISGDKTLVDKVNLEFMRYELNQ